MGDEASQIAGAQRGDTQAYAELVRAYEQVAFRPAYLITRDASDAADVAQEAFMRAYHALATFKPGQPFRPWLLRIVANLALNRLEAKQARDRMTERYVQQVMLDTDPPSPEGALMRREQSRRLLQAVDRLTPDERTIISLRYFLELPEAEVGDALHIPKGTVKSRLHRALSRLREVIQRDFPDLADLTIGD